MSYQYTSERSGATVLLDPSRPKLAAAVHLNGPWPHVVETVRSSLGAAREYLIERGYPKRGVPADELALEVIELTGDLDHVDRYLFRLVLGQMVRGERSKARQNGNGYSND